MRVPSRRVVVATALGAVAVLGATWLVLRGAGAAPGEALPAGDHSLAASRWGCLLADALAVAAALAALARLRGDWRRLPVGLAATWLAVATAAVVASEAGRVDWLVEAVGAVLAYLYVGSFVLVPLGGLALLFYAGFLATPPCPRLPIERFVAVAATSWALVVVPAAFGFIYLDVTGWEGFT